MRLCFLISKYPITGGGQVNLEYIFEHYKKNDIDVKIYTKCKMDPLSIINFITFIKKEKIDVIQAYDLKPEFILNTIFAKLAGKKIIFSCVGKLSEEQGIIGRALAVVFANRITVLSRVFMKSFPSRKNITFIPNGVDLKKFRPCNKKEKIILSVGRIDPIKNFEWLLMISKTFPDYKILIIGPIYRHSYYKKLLKIIQDNKINNVKFLHNVSHKNIEKYYQTAKIFTLTSKYEMFPGVILEAMACGTPVIARNIPNIHDIVKNNATLIDNEWDLENEISKILTNTTYYKNLQKKGIMLSKRYGIKNMLERYVKTVKDVYNE